jgi:hypothetical protein
MMVVVRDQEEIGESVSYHKLRARVLFGLL